MKLFKNKCYVHRFLNHTCNIYIHICVNVGSQTSLDCGIDGNPRFRIVDPKPGSTSYVKNLCMNVHGAESVKIIFVSLSEDNPPIHFEVICLHF